MVHLLSIFVLHVYLFNMYNCIWFSVMDYFFVLYIFVVLLVYHKSIMDFFFLLYIFVLLFLLHMLYILLFFETYCHIFMTSNWSSHLEKYTSLKSTKLHYTYDHKTEVQYGAKNGQKLHQTAP